MESLPTEIITEILARLPVKSLIRFLCVHKSWYSLIKSPDFIKNHLTQTLISNSENYLILSQRYLYISAVNFQNIYNPLSFSKIHDPLKPEQVQIIGSCNGILCISDFKRNNIFLYNPLTKSSRKLPVNRIRDFKTDWNDRVVYGFGYNSVTDDYKVFCFFQKLRMCLVEYNEAEVFSFKSNSWKSIEGISDLDFDFFANHNGVYLNDAMYYVVYKEEFDSDLRHKFILKFDFRTDTLLRLECPNFDDKFRNELFLSLSALQGCLCMLVSYFPDGTFPETQMGEEDCPLLRADLWMMKECGENENWVSLFSILDPREIGIEGEISSVVCSKDGSRILLAIDGSKLGWYDLENGRFETISICGHPEYWRNSELYFFSGSLVSLVDEKLQLEGRTMTKMKGKKRNLDNFLSVGFKLKL